MMRSVGNIIGNQVMKVGVEKLRAEISRVGHYWDREKVSDSAVRFNQRQIRIFGENRRV